MLRRCLALTIFLMSVLLGLGPAAPAAAAAPPARYFPATGHWVQGDFLAFFDQHGGLDMFGYPRTERMYSDGRLVQYFQRARFESWPENRPPYNVQLMLIGDAVMGPGDPPIPASQVPAPGDRSRTYFKATGHTLSGAFRDYFNQHGGLAIFGYPTSEPYVDASGFTVQRFQRARLELHPELPAAYQVSLGLLGDEYIFQLGKVPVSATAPVSGDQPPASITAGGRIVYQTTSGGNIVVASLDGSGAHVVAQGMDPSWSPDGKQIAFAVWGNNPGIDVVNADGTGLHQVYHDTQQPRGPIWSPDGTRIAFFQWIHGFVFKDGTWYDDNFSQVAVVRLSDGSTWLPPDQEQHAYAPSWSPDGQKLVYTADHGLYVVTANQPPQELPQLIPNTNGSFATPAWSPDGRQIAFTIRNGDHWDVGVINPDGTGAQILDSDPTLTPPVNNASVAWDPSGQHLIFASDRGGSGFSLYVMNRDGSGPAPISGTTLAYTGEQARVAAWGK